MIELNKENEELLFVMGQNFEINQRLVKIVEIKDVPYTNYTYQMIDEKMKPVLAKLNEVLYVMCSLGTMKQSGDEEEEQEVEPEPNKDATRINNEEIPEVKLQNPYETRLMAKTEITKVVLKNKF